MGLCRFGSFALFLFSFFFCLLLFGFERHTPLCFLLCGFFKNKKKAKVSWTVTTLTMNKKERKKKEQSMQPNSHHHKQRKEREKRNQASNPLLCFFPPHTLCHYFFGFLCFVLCVMCVVLKWRKKVPNQPQGHSMANMPSSSSFGESFLSFGDSPLS